MPVPDANATDAAPRGKLSPIALGVALYITVGAAYIVLSDLLLSSLKLSPEGVFCAGVFKGIGFVLVSGLVILLAFRREQSRTRLAQQAESQRAAQLRSIAQAVPGVIYRFSISSDERMTVEFIAGREDRVFGIPQPGSTRVLAEPDPRYHPDDYQRGVEIIRESVRTRAPASGVFRVRRPDGQVRWMLQRANVWRRDDGSSVFDGIALDIDELKSDMDAAREGEVRARRSFAETEGRLQLLLDQFPAVIWSTDRTLRYTFARGEMLKDLGLSPEFLVSTDLRTVHGNPPDDDPAVAAHLAAFRGETSRFRLPFQDRWYDCVVTPLRDNAGAIVGALGAAIDTTNAARYEREMAAALGVQQALLLELDHRVRNSFSSLVTLISASRETYESVGTFADAIHGRVAAMTSVHNLLTSMRWSPVPLTQLARRVLGDQRSDAIAMAGPEITIPPRQATALGMILHELAANSAKYGALSSPDGRVRIDWSAKVQAPADLTMTWRESGGPRVEAPSRTGLGTTLLQGFARFELRGEIELAYEPEGVRFTLHARLDDTSAQSAQDSTIAAPDPGLPDLRVTS